jgi:hypothetical protein
LVKSNFVPIPVLKEIQAYESDGVPLRHLGRHKQKETHSVFVSDASDNVAFVYEAETVRLVKTYRRLCLRKKRGEKQ